MLDLAFDLLSLALNRRWVVPLYTQVDAHRLYRVPAGSYNVSGSVTKYTCLTIQVIPIWRFILMGFKPPLGLGPFNESS